MYNSTLGKSEEFAKESANGHVEDLCLSLLQQYTYICTMILPSAASDSHRGKECFRLEKGCGIGKEKGSGDGDGETFNIGLYVYAFSLELLAFLPMP